MFKKALALSCVAATVLGTAFAGGNDTSYNEPTAPAPAPAPAPIVANTNYLYGHINVGNANHRWQRVFENVNDNWKRGNWQPALGFDLGYHFAPHMAIEGGYYRFMKARVTRATVSHDFKSSATYVAFKGDFSPRNNVSVFAKIGIGKQLNKANSFESAGTNTFQIKDKTGVMFGTGVSYRVMSNLDLQASYLHFYGDVNVGGASQTTIPAVDLFTFGIGYRFGM
jgi:opacity protein-like surface antigen